MDLIPNYNPLGSLADSEKKKFESALELKMRNAAIEFQLRQQEQIANRKFETQERVSPGGINLGQQLMGKAGLKGIFAADNQEEYKTQLGALKSLMDDKTARGGGDGGWKPMKVGNSQGFGKMAFDREGQPAPEFAPVGVDPSAYREYAKYNKDLAPALSNLNSMEVSAGRLLSKGGILGRTANATKIKWQDLSGNANQDVVNFKRNMELTALQMAAIINRGRPTDKDKEAVQSAHPRTWDTIATAQASIKSLKKVLKSSQKNYYNELILGQMENPNIEESNEEADPNNPLGL